jgi:uroporphyrinogen decarboxylase
MKPRERVEMALHHQEPDRCPVQVSFTPEFAAWLRQDMELRGNRVHNPHGGGNTYELERPLGEDVLLTSSQTRRTGCHAHPRSTGRCPA